MHICAYTLIHSHAYTRSHAHARAHRHTVSQVSVLSTQVRYTECQVYLHDEKCVQGTCNCEHLHEDRQPSSLTADPKLGSEKPVGFIKGYSQPPFRGHYPTSPFQETSLQHSVLLQLQAPWE